MDSVKLSSVNSTPDCCGRLRKHITPVVLVHILALFWTDLYFDINYKKAEALKSLLLPSKLRIGFVFFYICSISAAEEPGLYLPVTVWSGPVGYSWNSAEFGKQEGAPLTPADAWNSHCFRHPDIFKHWPDFQSTYLAELTEGFQSRDWLWSARCIFANAV